MKVARSMYDDKRERIAQIEDELKVAQEKWLEYRDMVNNLRAERKEMLKLQHFPRPHKSWKRISGPGAGHLKYVTRDEMYVLCIRDNQLVLGLLDTESQERWIYWRDYTVVWRGPERNHYFEAAIDLYERVAQPAPEE